MNGGIPPSPYVSNNTDFNGKRCNFTLNYSNIAPRPLTSLVVTRDPGCVWIAVQVTNATTLVTDKFDISTKTGTFTIPAAMLNAAGYVNYSDLGSYTLATQ